MLIRVKRPYVNVSVRIFTLLEPRLMILAYVYMYCDVMECAVCSSFARRISMYMSLHEKEHMHITNTWLHVFMLDVIVT